MINAEYVKNLGLEFKDLTAKIEDYSETDKLYTWGILNKKTNKRIGSYHSLDKKDFPVVPVIIGEWLLQEDEEDAYISEDPKASLRNALCRIALEFVNDTSISDIYLYRNNRGYFAKRQCYIDAINKFFGKDLCGIYHVSFPDGERKKIYIAYDGLHYTLGSAYGEKKDICHENINEFVEKYMNDKYSENPKAHLRNNLCAIALEFVNDVVDGVMIDQQAYIDKINKLLRRNICGVRHIIFPDDEEETNIYVWWEGQTYRLGSVVGHKADIDYKRINEFVDIYQY